MRASRLREQKGSQLKKILTSAAIILWAAFPLRAAKNIRLTLYHTNDIHGWIMARPQHPSHRRPGTLLRGRQARPQHPSHRRPGTLLRGTQARPEKGDSQRLVGGMAILAAYLKRAPEPKLILDAGDWFQGTPEGSLTKGRAVAATFNALHYDVVEVGNHDFDFGEDRLKKLVQSLKMPVLGANVYSKKTGKRVSYLKPYILKTVDGVKVGILGLLTTNMPNLTFPENIVGLRFRREIDEAKGDVRALKAKGATVIIALTHVGIRTRGRAPFEDDRFIAAHVPGIDVIVGGHSHTLLPHGTRDPVNHTLIVQTGCYLTRVGKVVLAIDAKTGRVIKSRASVIRLRVDKIGRDSSMQKIVSRYQNEVGRKMNIVLGQATKTLTRNSAGESDLGDWMADCLRSWAKTDVAFQNSGGIRADLSAGPVTWRDIFDLMPFDNYVATMSLQGSQIQNILEHAVSGDQGIIQVSGLSFQYNPRAKSGHRVLSISVNGSPLISSASYSAATLNFLAEGGDGYTSFGRGQGLHVARALVRDVFAECAEKSPIQSKKSERISQKIGIGK